MADNLIPYTTRGFAGIPRSLETLHDVVARAYPGADYLERLQRAESILAVNPQLRWLLLSQLGVVTVNGNTRVGRSGQPLTLEQIMGSPLPANTLVLLPAPSTAASRPASVTQTATSPMPEEGSSEVFTIFPKEWLSKDGGRFIANYTGVVKDSIGVGEAIREVGFWGKMIVKKDRKGREYVILKGIRAAREVLKKKQYLSTHPEIMAFGLGPAAAKAGAKAGARLTFALFAVAEAADLLCKFLTDEAFDLRDAVGTLSSDAAKVAISTAASYMASVAVAGATGVAFVASGPLIVGVVVGIAVGVGLDYLDFKFDLTKNWTAVIKSGTDSLATCFNAAANSARAAYDDTAIEFGRMLYDGLRSMGAPLPY